METFPEIAFASTGVAKTGDDTFEVTGDLTIKGVTRSVTVEFDYTGTAVDPKDFQTLNAERVQLKTDDRNVVSQRAIERIGGQLDGILRHDRLTWSGHRRSSHMYSLIRAEWPEIRTRLEALLR